MNRFFARTVFLAILVMALCGCGENIPDSTPTPIETETISDTPTLSPTSTKAVVVEAALTITEQSDLSTATATALPDAPLSEEGPWLVFVAQLQDVPYLWAINPDGTGLTQLTDKATYRFDVNQGSDGEVSIAYITSDSEVYYSDLQLSILKLRGGEVETTIDLTSPETAYTHKNSSDEEYWTEVGIAEAILSEDSFKWSPDGKWLAFVGAVDGPSADVYSYEAATGTTRQLTSGADNAFQLLWSPDSAWILHTAKDIWLHSG